MSRRCTEDASQRLALMDLDIEDLPLTIAHPCQQTRRTAKAESVLVARDPVHTISYKIGVDSQKKKYSGCECTATTIK